MTGVGAWFALGAFVCLVMISRPPAYRLLARWFERLSDRHAAACARRELARQDPDEAELWRWNRRMRLCAALRRIERIVETDDYMSATRQIANRMARDQLLGELRRDGDLTVAWFASGDEWFEPAAAVGWLPQTASTSRSSVELLDYRGTRAIHSKAA